MDLTSFRQEETTIVAVTRGVTRASADRADSSRFKITPAALLAERDNQRQIYTHDQGREEPSQRMSESPHQTTPTESSTPSQASASTKTWCQPPRQHRRRH